MTKTKPKAGAQKRKLGPTEIAIIAAICSHAVGKFPENTLVEHPRRDSPDWFPELWEVFVANEINKRGLVYKFHEETEESGFVELFMNYFCQENS